MIPKIIHYCWLSKDPLPMEVRECMASWKKHLPDWTIKHWGMNEFDVNSVPFVAEAVAARKWAFAADYIRVYALYHEGGVYLDSDVLVRKNMDFALENRAFSAVEFFPQHAEEALVSGLIDVEGNKLVPEAKVHGIQVQAAIIGAEKGHPFFKECLEYYNARHFSAGDDGIPAEDQISPIVFAGIAEKYGFKYCDREQNLSEGFKLYPSRLFTPQPWMMKPEAVAVHCCNASWRTTLTPIDRLVTNLKIRIKSLLTRLGLRREKAIDKIR